MLTDTVLPPSHLLEVLLAEHSAAHLAALPYLPDQGKKVIQEGIGFLEAQN